MEANLLLPTSSLFFGDWMATGSKCYVCFKRDFDYCFLPQKQEEVLGMVVNLSRASWMQFIAVAKQDVQRGPRC